MSCVNLVVGGSRASDNAFSCEKGVFIGGAVAL